MGKKLDIDLTRAKLIREKEEIERRLRDLVYFESLTEPDEEQSTNQIPKSSSEEREAVESKPVKMETIKKIFKDYPDKVFTSGQIADELNKLGIGVDKKRATLISIIYSTLSRLTKKDELQKKTVKGNKVYQLKKESESLLNENKENEAP